MLSALLVFFAFFAGTEKAQLEQAVASYWNSLHRQDKNAALDFVLPESRNDFILRREPYFRSWKPLSIEAKSQNEASVTVVIERMVESSPGHFFDQKVEELWKFDGQNWKVKVEKVSPETFYRIFDRSVGSPPQEPKAAVLRVLPEQVKIHFLSHRQLGEILVENGLRVPAQIVRVEYEETKFNLIQQPVEIKPGETARIVIEYKGDEIEKDLKSQVTLVFRQGKEEKAFTVPVLYNYLSPAARGLFGLKEEDAQKLRRDEKLTPVLKPPAAAQKPSEKPPTPR